MCHEAGSSPGKPDTERLELLGSKGGCSIVLLALVTLGSVGWMVHTTGRAGSVFDHFLFWPTIVLGLPAWIAFGLGGIEKPSKLQRAAWHVSRFALKAYAAVLGLAIVYLVSTWADEHTKTMDPAELGRTALFVAVGSLVLIAAWIYSLSRAFDRLGSRVDALEEKAGPQRELDEEEDYENYEDYEDDPGE